MIGSNSSLRAAGSNPPAKPIYQSQPKTPAINVNGQGAYTGRSSIKQPNYIDINTTEDAANSVLALGAQAADPRYHLKQTARNGVSMGKGQQFIAGQEGAMAQAEAAGKAAEIRQQDMMANSKMRSDYENLREKEAQNLAMVQHSVSQSDWARQFAQQSAQAQLQMAQYQAQLQLMLALMR